MITFLCLAFSATINSLAYFEILESPNSHTVCIIAECYGPRTGNIFFMCMTTTGAMASLSYLAIGSLLKRGRVANGATQRIFKSLLTTTAFVVVCYIAVGLMQ